MSESKHTPGPWHMERDNLLGANDEVVATVYQAADFGMPECGPECLANARLIAAAPDLLAAADEALQVLHDLAPELVEQPEYAAYFNAKNGHGRRVILLLEAALAKAAK